MKPIQIATSILAADFTRLGAQIQEAEEGGADLIHIDVMDGRFVPNITMGPLVVEAVRRVTALPLDVHLMIVEPERYLEAFARAGASNICVHYETCPHLHRTLQQIRDLGCKAGVALNPHTAASAVTEVLDLIDLINVMTVNPGFGGQRFLGSMMPKLARLHAMTGETGRDILLEVDGGINLETGVVAAQAGANVLVTGNAIFQGGSSIAENIVELRRSLNPNE